MPVATLPKYPNVRAKAVALINRSVRHVRFITEEMVADDLSVHDWHRQMVDEVKMLHGAMMIAAKGGVDLDDLELSQLNAIVADQLDYLNDFAVDLSDGRVEMNGQVVSRALMYVRAAWSTFEHGMKERVVEGVGRHDRQAKWERRVLSDAEHCDGCVREAKRGWRRVGSLTPIGGLECLTNCKCHFEYSDSDRKPR